MKIRSKLILIGTIPVALLLALATLFLAAANHMERANNKATVADHITNQFAELSILTYEHHVYFEERAHVQWLEKYGRIGKQIKEQAALFDDPKEKELVERINRTYRNLGFLFEQYGPLFGQTQLETLTDQGKSFRNRITARLLQELAVATPASTKLHDLNHDRAITLSQRIDVLSVLVVSVVTILLLFFTFLVDRAFSVPVRKLSEAFARVSNGELSCRINSLAQDELGGLARSFDSMAQRLAESDDSLRRMNLELEQRVDERTRQLSGANQELLQTINERQAAEEAVKLNEERLAALLELSQRKFGSEDELMVYALEEGVRLTKSEVGYLHFYNDEQQTLGLFHWSKAVMGFCTAAKTAHYPLQEAGVWADCVRQRQAVVHNDYPNLATKKGVPEGHFPLSRHLSIPIFEGEQIVAVVGVGNKAEPYEDADIRQLTLFMSSTWEIVMRKRAETLLHESEKRYRTIFEESPDGIVLIDMETTRAVEFNEVACRQLGYSREEFAQLPVADYEAKEQADEIRDHFEKITQLGRERFDTLHRTKSGEIRNVAVYKQALTIGGRQYLYAIFRDITELRQAQEESAFKAKLLDASSDSIFLVNLEGKIVFVNEAAFTTRGYQRQEMIGMTVAALDTPEFASQVGGRIQQILEHGESVFESAHRCKDGSVMPIEIHAQSIEVKGERLILSTIRDISERKRGEEALRKYAVSLERSNQELEHFAYVASHDLQEPLRKIGSFTELLARKYQDRLDDKAGTYINYIVDGAHRMQILINDLLSFSRVTTKGREFAAVDCNQLLQRVQRDIELAAQESGARIKVHELPTVLADEVQLGQVFQNLIVNAIKYRDQDHAPEIELAARKSGGEWIFSVSDNGIGIEAQHFERVFQLFQRLHTREEYSGTGIGLALCKKIVERHGGHIWVESTPGQGSTFYFTIALSLATKNELQIT